MGVLCSAVDQDCTIHEKKGHRSLKSPTETVEQIVKDLIEQKVFDCSRGRDGYTSFESFPKNLLHDLDYRVGLFKSRLTLTQD